MKSRLSVIAAMVIFGTIGIFRKYIDLPSSGLAVARGLIGAAFLLLVVLITGKKLDKAAIKSNLWLLLVSGAFIGINWMLLFESYRYTTVATATLCYYLAPVFVVLLSPLMLKERLSLIKGICAAVAVLGMVFVSGVFEGGLDLSRLPGILFGVGAAAFYAAVILLNKKMKPIPAMDCTVIQLAAAALVLVPYTLLVEDYAAVALSPLGIGLLVAVGVVHTGIAYALYFGSVHKLPAQTVAIFSYIDPVVAILLSALFLQEPMTVWGWVGAVLILGSTLVSELSATKKHLD
jgi:RarD protein